MPSHCYCIYDRAHHCILILTVIVIVFCLIIVIAYSILTLTVVIVIAYTAVPGIELTSVWSSLLSQRCWLSADVDVIAHFVCAWLSFDCNQQNTSIWVVGGLCHCCCWQCRHLLTPSVHTLRCYGMKVYIVNFLVSNKSLKFKSLNLNSTKSKWTKW